MKNQKKTLIIAGIAATVVVLAIAGFFIFKSMQPSPEKAWSSYVDLLKEKNMKTCISY